MSKLIYLTTQEFKQHGNHLILLPMGIGPFGPFGPPGRGNSGRGRIHPSGSLGYFIIGPPSGGLCGGLFAIVSIAKIRIKIFRNMSTNYV